MALTHTLVAGREQCLQQIERLTNSHSLRGSESLCKLLRYLAEHSLDHPGIAPKEYQIATEVLGRAPGFDPQSDSTVRVQAGRLRMKLADYYAHEGADDPVAVDLPKGSYSLTFHLRPAGPASTAGAGGFAPKLAVVEREKTESRSGRGWVIAVVALTAMLAASLAGVALLAFRVHAPVETHESVPAVYRIFWDRFVSSPQRPWVIFSNANFVGQPQTNMRYFNAVTDSRATILDHYTGVGEVLAVHQLDQVFSLLRGRLQVKRGALFSLDDAKNNDLIFIGSPAENLTLLEIPGTQEFIFHRTEAGPRKGDMEVLNVHPRSGEPKSFMSSPTNNMITEDYAVVALVPGIDPVRSMLILAGTTTMGTQAAAEFVCRQDSLEELLHRLGVSQPSDLQPFEALLRVKVTHGVPVKTDLISVRGGRS